jgi:DNA-directed RNA polymerase subunit N (RpoN/RPB10)
MHVFKYKAGYTKYMCRYMILTHSRMKVIMEVYLHIILYIGMQVVI